MPKPRPFETGMTLLRRDRSNTVGYSPADSSDDQIINEWVAQAHPHTTVEAINSPPGFVAECEMAPGALAIGRTEEEARQQMQSVLSGWASLVLEDGGDLPYQHRVATTP